MIFVMTSGADNQGDPLRHGFNPKPGDRSVLVACLSVYLVVERPKNTGSGCIAEAGWRRRG